MPTIDETIASLQKRLRILEDKEALSTLLYEYCNTADAKDWAGYANTYIPNGTMTFEEWGSIQGHGAIAKTASSEEIFEGLQRSMTNMHFALDGDEATGTAYLWMCVTPKVQRPEVHYAFGGPLSV